jgi:membrane protein YqaA with SNARE-associated domain
LTKLLRLFTKYKLWLLALLKPLGFWGVGCLAFIDAAAIPIPQDLIVAGYVWEDKRHFYVYVIISAVGSALGGLVPYLVGLAGGELFLMKRIDRVRFNQLRDRFERQEFLAIMIPSLLPPPFPWKVCAFGAGVFEMKVVNFLLAVFAGRAVRDLITAILTIKYGPEIIKVLVDLATVHSTLLLVLFCVIIGLIVAGWLLYRRRQEAKKRKGEDHTPETEDQIRKS